MRLTARPPHLLHVKRRTTAISVKYIPSGNPAAANSIFAECWQLKFEHVTLKPDTPMLFNLAIVGGGMCSKLHAKEGDGTHRHCT